MRAFKIAAGGTAVSLTLALGACNGAPDHPAPAAAATPRIQMDSVSKMYRSVDELAKDSTVAVLGTFERVVDRAEDNGGMDGSPGTPMVLYSFKVERHSGKADLPESIRVAYIDTDRVETDDVEPVSLGGRYVLFLTARSLKTAPGLKKWLPLYVPTGEKAAVFQVDETGSAIAVSADLQSLTAGAPRAHRERDRLAVPAEDLIGMRTG